MASFGFAGLVVLPGGSLFFKGKFSQARTSLGGSCKGWGCVCCSSHVVIKSWSAFLWPPLALLAWSCFRGGRCSLRRSSVKPGRLRGALARAGVVFAALVMV